ncbi:hypothetical protein [Mucilaginibacter antarcticus]|uniref:hypothetical protein n=1 Tax=Mucilaginibacter antarcticus TaxID=1855725 RepID=UPI00362C19DF
MPVGTDSFAAAALKHLITQGYPAVNVVTDEFDLTDYLLFADQINLVIFHQHEKIYGIAPGFSKWKPGGEGIRLLSLPENLNTTGLKRVDELTYITAADGFFTLDFVAPLLFIAEQL